MSGIVIQRGDTISKIAQKYGYTKDELCKFNGITNPDKIYIGQKLAFPERRNTNYNARTSASNPSDSNISLETRIKKSEGEKKATYFAPEGKATIGWGHQLTNIPRFLRVINGKDISREQKEQLLQDALQNPKNRAALKKAIEQNLQSAIAKTKISVNPEINDNLELTKEQMSVLLKADIKKTEEIISQRIGRKAYQKLNKNQKEALIDLFYNVGAYKKAPKLIGYIKANEYDKAQAEFDFFKSNGKIEGGLIRRNYQRMLMWGNGKLSPEAKARVLDAYNNCYGTNVKNISEIEKWLNG